MSRKPFREHRWGTRTNLEVPAQIKCHDGRGGAATVRNASVSGALIESSLKLPVFSRVAVRPLSRPGPGLDAHVVRIDASGFAVEWSHPAARPLSNVLPLPDADAAQPDADHARQRRSTLLRPAESFA